MKVLLLFLCFSILGFSCSQKGIQTATNESKKEKGVFHHLVLTANNLSEDANIISTQNDELVLFLYSNVEREFPNVVLQEDFTIDSIGTSKVFKIKKRLQKEEELVLVLIEKDTELTLEQINLLVNSKLNELLKYYQNTNQEGVRSLIGDDDLLFIEKSSFRKIKAGIRIQGIHLFDAYDYLIEIE